MKQTHSVALAALLSVVLVGCSDNDPQPKITPSPPSSSSSPTAPPTTAPPEPSETAVALSPEDTVRAWVEARNQAVQDGDTSAVAALSDQSCKTCRDSYEPLSQVYADGGHYNTTGWRVSAAKVRKQDSDSAEVAAGLVYAAGSTVPSAGARPVSYEIEQHIAIFRFTNTSGAWKLTEMVYLS